MKKKISVATSLVLILFAVFLTFQITYTFVEKEYQKKVDTLTQKQSDFSKLVAADLLIRENYKGAIDEEAMEEGLIKGYLSSLGDRYARYLTAEEYRTYQNEQKGIGTGIGARFSYHADTEETLIYTVFPASPAEKTGLRKGDVLYQVDDTLVSELGFYGAVQALTGEPGTTVRVTVLRTVAAQTLKLDFTLTREAVEETTVSYEILPERVGYVQIFEIGDNTATEFSSAISALLTSDVACLILDVRNCSGSNLDAACAMADLLLSEGTVMTLTARDGTVTEKTSDAACVELPMAVLVNGTTSCAPELFAAALQDYGTAILVGEKTYGKASLQTVVEMDNGAAMILTNSDFLPPSQISFEGTGLTPDRESVLKKESIYSTDKEDDNQLQDAIASLWQ